MRVLETWAHQYIQTAEDDRPITQSMDWQEAQKWCNFTLLKPSALPADVQITEKSMRPERPPLLEAAANSAPDWTRSVRAVHRSVLTGKRRKLRIKQFLYDYAPPAFDHPGLWESPQLTAFAVKNNIGWLGLDFRKLPGASLHIDRTMVEVSVLNGQFADEELQQICQGLQPVDSAARDAVIRTSLAALCYQRRHQESPIGVPTGHWKHVRSANWKQQVFDKNEVPPTLHAYKPRLQADSGFELSCGFAFYDRDALRELDWVYESIDDPTCYLRILVAPASSDPASLQFPPTIEKQHPSRTLEHRIRDHQIFHAFIDDRYGQHEAVWKNDQNVLLTVCKPTPSSATAWFVSLLEKLV